jgi:hypothetical protein
MTTMISSIGFECITESTLDFLIVPNNLKGMIKCPIGTHFTLKKKRENDNTKMCEEKYEYMTNIYRRNKHSIHA